MKHLSGLLVVAGLLVATPAAGEMTLTIQDGRVTLICTNATARQILTEWARLGQTKVVNAEKLGGPPLTLRLENVPERQALDILLRSASGYMVAERPTLVASASLYDRILIMPTSTPAPPASAVARPPVMPVQQPQPVAQPAGDDEAEAAEDAPVQNPYTDNRPPETQFDYANPQEFLRRRQELMQQQLQQQQQAPAQPAVFPGTIMPGTTGVDPGAATGAPVGAARPGEIIKAPQPTSPQVVNPYGLPYNVQPGSAVTTPMEPDRAKYANPYQPTPPQEPKDD